MNKILKLLLSDNEEDIKIAALLLKNDKVTKKHLLNIAWYLGVRNYSTKLEGIYDLYDTIYNTGIISDKVFENMSNHPHVKSIEGKFYTAAMRSLKKLQNE